MGWSWESKARGAYMFAIAMILVWLVSKVVVVEEGLKTDGGELDDDEYDLLISDLGDWILVDTTNEVVVKEGEFTVTEDCEEIWDATAVRQLALQIFEDKNYLYY